jgi:AcrR family transcriptional regulator
LPAATYEERISILVTSVEKLAAPQRRQAILEASMALLARQGLQGVTTRQIAAAAQVSEGLLYRHFRSKEEIYRALQQSCLEEIVSEARQIDALEPSTATLVLTVHFMFARIVPSGPMPLRQRHIKQLGLQSLLTDGDFAREYLRATVIPFIPKLLECFAVAERHGDLVQGVPAQAELWFCHHLATMLGYYLLPDTPVVTHEQTPEALLERAVLFALRGLGLHPDAIRRHYQPRALELLSSRLPAG